MNEEIRETKRFTNDRGFKQNDKTKPRVSEDRGRSDAARNELFPKALNPTREDSLTGSFEGQDAALHKSVQRKLR